MSDLNMHYSKRLCPELSPATLARTVKPEATSCQGIACMWFVPELGANGQIVNGACAVTMNVILKLQKEQSNG